MLTELHLQNFRSILEANIKFSTTGLSVVVGANGSGKSNLIKALDFISRITERGLEAAIVSVNGFEAIIPKAIAAEYTANTMTSISFSVNLNMPSSYPDDAPPILVDYQLGIGMKDNNLDKIEIKHERMTFHEPLLVSHLLSNKKRIKDSSNYHEYIAQKSHLIIFRKANERLSVEENPKFDKYNAEAYLSWSGLSELISKFRLGENDFNRVYFQGMIMALFPFPKTIEEKSFIDPMSSFFFERSEIGQIFFKQVSGIKKYDLLLNELRSEQQQTSLKLLSSEGQNMPSVLRHLISGKDEESFTRILGTLKDIAPFVAEIDVDSLPGGKEFIKFIESLSRKSVESWESSDGTLRALAILLALETTPIGSTILIEEPEQALHPWAINYMLRHIREVIEKRKIQVILTTHSQQVLENIYPEELFVATRDKESGTKFLTLKELLPHHSIEMGEVGRMWVRGLLGGVPSYDEYI